MAVATGTILKSRDVIKNIDPSQIPGFVNMLSNALFFQRTEERLSYCVIPTVTLPTHAR